MRFHPLTYHDKLPKQFTYPFNYSPDKLSLLASEELISFLDENWKDFFFEQSPIGKMFGVLVVQNTSGELGFLAAFSGKLKDENLYDYFVPPVFDTLDQTGFYKLGEKELDKFKLIKGKLVKVLKQL